MNEIKQARRVAEKTSNPEVKQILNQFLSECPNCGLGRDSWIIDIDTIYNPPISEDFIKGYDLVRYRCDCGCVFKKIEDK